MTTVESGNESEPSLTGSDALYVLLEGVAAARPVSQARAQTAVQKPTEKGKETANNKENAIQSFQRTANNTTNQFGRAIIPIHASPE